MCFLVFFQLIITFFNWRFFWKGKQHESIIHYQMPQPNTFKKLNRDMDFDNRKIEVLQKPFLLHIILLIIKIHYPKKVRDCIPIYHRPFICKCSFHWTFQVVIHLFFIFLQLIHGLHPHFSSMQLYHYSWNKTLEFSSTLSFGENY